MQIIFKNIILHNFMSFEDSDIELYKNGFVFVRGTNNNVDDNAKSNGSGKSSIWEAISWVLTGETLRGTKDVQRYGSDNCFVDLTFNCDGLDYRVKRTKSPSNLFIYVNGEDKSGKGIRDTEKILTEYFPDITESLINSVIILGQGLPQRFTNNSPAGRKEVLEKLSKSDYLISDMKRRIDSRTSFVSKQLRSLEDYKIKLNTQLESNRSSLQRAIESIKALELSDVEAEKIKINNYKKDIENLDLEINELQDALREESTKYDNYMSSYYSLQSEESSEKTRISNTYSEQLLPWKETLSETKINYKALLEEIRRLESVKDTCPTCGQKLPGIYKVDTSDKRELLTKLDNSRSELENKIKSIEQEFTQETLEVSVKYSARKQKLSEDISSSKSAISSLQLKIKSKNSAIASNKESIIRLENYVSNYDQKKLDLQNQKTQIDSEIKKLEEDLLYNNNELENIKSHIDVLNKFSTAVKRDFRGYLLTNVITFINSSAKKYSKKMFNTDKLNFCLDGNNISISYNEKEYENLSGGEKQKVDLCIQFSLRDMLCTFLNFSCNILVLDEITDNLDEVGCQRVIDLISTGLSDIDSVYIISHRSDLSIPYDKELIVEKDSKGISKCMMI